MALGASACEAVGHWGFVQDPVLTIVIIRLFKAICFLAEECSPHTVTQEVKHVNDTQLALARIAGCRVTLLSVLAELEDALSNRLAQLMELSLQTWHRCSIRGLLLLLHQVLNHLRKEKAKEIEAHLRTSLQVLLKC